MLWTPEQDRLLLSVAEANKDQVWDKVAQEASEKLGQPITADQARSRTRRIREQIRLSEALPSPVLDDRLFDLPEVPKETFVGFRMAFFDIETTDLKAGWGRMLCASIADSWGNVTTRTIYDFVQESIIDDSGLAEWLRDELEKYEIIVGWNSKLFDIGFLTARLLRWGKRPPRSDLKHLDLMYRARPGAGGARIGSSSLENVSHFFRIQGKTKLSGDIWQLAAAGDGQALAYVVEHCEADVLVLRRVFHHLKPLVQTVHR